jgi:hypothetical protein
MSYTVLASFLSYSFAFACPGPMIGFFPGPFLALFEFYSRKELNYDFLGS